jgi:hypothetical protein
MDSSMLILAQRYGHLGNRLVLFSHLIACARENDLKLVNLAFSDYAHLFQTTRDVAFPGYPLSGSTRGAWRWLQSAVYLAARWLSTAAGMLRCTEMPIKIIRLKGEEPMDLASEEFLDVARRRKWVLLQGWCFRDHSAVRRHADAIREYFEPIPEHREHVAEVVSTARVDADVLVGVHIRHGDYAEFRDGRYYFSVPQYVGAMQAMARLLEPQEVRFLVCSDVPQDIESFGDLNVTLGPGHQVEDMYALAECDYLVGPPSTYSAWASFFGKVPLYRMEDPGDAFDLDAFAICEAL